MVGRVILSRISSLQIEFAQILGSSILVGHFLKIRPTDTFPSWTWRLSSSSLLEYGQVSMFHSCNASFPVG